MALSPEVLAILMFVCLLVLVFMGQPLAFTLGSLAVVFGLVGWGPSSFGLFADKCWGLMKDEVLVAVPLFIFMAQMLDRSGVAEKMYESMHIVMGRLRGGLLAATIVVCTVFAATTGIIGASVVAMGLLAAPAMLRRGYDKSMVAGAVCAGGTLGILIPPSIMLIVYGSMTQQSVGRLFAAALMPGLVLSGLFLVYVLVRCGFRPQLGPPLPPEERTQTGTEKLRLAAGSTVPPLGLIFAVLGTILAGIATPTEAAGMGGLGAMLLALVYRKFTWRALHAASLETLRTTSMIMLLFVGGSCFSAIFVGLGGDALVEDLLLGIESQWAILAIMMAIVFVLGMFIDWLGILLVCIPVFQPIAVDTLGFDPLWFTLLVCVNLQSSFLTPPFGYALFYFKGVAPPGVTMMDVYRGIWPFVLLQLAGLVAIILLPSLATWLPAVLFGS